MNKKKDAELNPQAERVEKLFPSREKLFSQKIKEKASSFAYHLLKLPSKSILRSMLSSKKEDKKILAATPKFLEKSSQKNIFLKKWGSRDSLSIHISIAPERVKKWRLKESLLAANRLKDIKHKTASVCTQQITLLQPKEQEGRKEPQKEAWEELIQHKEERHFYLTRITKFFID